MFMRNLLILFLVFTALVFDLGLPVWSHARSLPSCLDLVFLAVCATTNGASTVFWAGLIGSGFEFVNSSPVGPGILSAATLALLAVWFRTEELGHRRTVIDRILTALVMLVLLEAMRTLLGAVLDPAAFPPSFATLGTRLAMTFLIAAGLCLALPGRRLSFGRSGL
jgi:hypothetical protein